MQGAKCRVQSAKWRTAAAVVLAAALLVGCEPSVEDYLPEPNVYCVVRAGNDTLRLLAGMSIPYKDSVPQSPDWNGVAGVQATVRGRAVEVTLAAKPDSAGYYHYSGFAPQAGETLELEARYPSGEFVRGGTMVPGAFGIERVAADTVFDVWWPGETLWSLRLELHWSASPHAARYGSRLTVFWSSADTSIEQAWTNQWVSGTADSARLTFQYYYENRPGELDSAGLDSVRLGVEAADRNLADYREFAWWMGGSNRELLHLDGGLGVFGSRTVCRDTVVRLSNDGCRSSISPIQKRSAALKQCGRPSCGERRLRPADSRLTDDRHRQVQQVQTVTVPPLSARSQVTGGGNRPFPRR